MNKFALLAVCMIMLAACATPAGTAPRAPDFSGRYHRPARILLPEGGAVATNDDMIVGRTRHGRARLSIALYFGFGHQCALDGDAAVTPTGLLYRDVSDDTQEPFVLAVDIAGQSATLRVVEGSGYWLCGVGGRWGGEAFVKG